MPPHRHHHEPHAHHAEVTVDLEHLRVVLRESHGLDKRDEALVPMPPIEQALPNGMTVTMTPAWFAYIGDMHLRLVFEGPDALRSASRDDLERMKLTPRDAVAVAFANLERAYGPPAASPWNELMRVSGKSPDFDSSWFLDRAFWRQREAMHPSGLVVAVPHRGGLLYAPQSDIHAVSLLRQRIHSLHEGSGAMRLSGALYLFSEDHWHVYRAAPR